MDNLPLGPIIAFAQDNFVTQIFWNTLLNSHSSLLTFFGFGIVGLESSDIGFSTPTTMPKEETPIVNKDLLLPSCNSKEGANKILFFATINLELDEGLIRTREKKCLNLRFIGGFSGAIIDGVEED